MLRALLVVVVVSGCGAMPFPGAPVAGTACGSTVTLPECVTAGEIAYCESGKWVEYACPSDCRNAQPNRCDWSKAKVGDACPAAMEGERACPVVCTQGKFAACP